MITLTNGHSFEYVTASGAMAYDGKGWWYEQPYRWARLIKSELFTHFTKTLTFEEEKGNLRWWWPFSCIKWLEDDGLANKVRLTNPGIDWWCRVVAPQIEKSGLKIVVSITGTPEELEKMAARLSYISSIVGIEVNPSCPNTKKGVENTEAVIKAVRAVYRNSRHPLFLKLSCTQECVDIVLQCKGYVQAINFNSVPWTTVFGTRPSPLASLPGDGGGGVSGKPAQKFNWPAMEKLAKAVPEVPVIAPSVMCYRDLAKVRALGAKAIAFGTIHIQPPWNSYMPTKIVEREMRERLEQQNIAKAPVGMLR